MEGNLLNLLGGPSRKSRPVVSLSALDERMYYLQAHSIERTTALGYRTGARAYISFCMNHNIPIAPTPLTLARFVTYTSQYIGSSSKYLTGARHFLIDIFPEWDQTRDNPMVKATLSGSRKVRADPVRRKLPLRLCHLQAFYAIAKASGSYDDLLFVTLLSCGFYSCHRTGELVAKTKAGFDWNKLIKRSSLFFRQGRVGYILPYHKGDRFYRGSEVLMGPHAIANPVELVGTFVEWRDRLHGARPALFLRENGEQPTRAWWDSKLFALLDRDYGGHSVRAGGATYFAELGLSEDIIAAIGRWASETFKIYIRDNPTVRAEIQLAQIRALQRHHRST